MPQEEADRIDAEIGEWPMALAEARWLRRQMLDEEATIHTRVNGEVVPYRFSSNVWIGGVWP